MSWEFSTRTLTSAKGLYTSQKTCWDGILPSKPHTARSAGLLRKCRISAATLGTATSGWATSTEPAQWPCGGKLAGP